MMDEPEQHKEIHLTILPAMLKQLMAGETVIVEDQDRFRWHFRLEGVTLESILKDVLEIARSSQSQNHKSPNQDHSRTRS